MLNSRVFCGGMYRSGTTLIYNFLKECGISDIPKFHEKWIKKMDGSQSIYCYRDVRDIVASFCHKENTSFDEFRIENLKNITPMRLAARMIRLHRSTMRFRNKNPNRILILKYESDIVNCNLEDTFDKITEFLGIERDNRQAAKDLSIDSIKKITDNLNGVDTVTHFWPNHIVDGSVGKYRMFTDEQINEFENSYLIRKWLYKNGYSLRGMTDG